MVVDSCDTELKGHSLVDSLIFVKTTSLSNSSETGVRYVNILFVHPRNNRTCTGSPEEVLIG